MELEKKDTSLWFSVGGEFCVGESSNSTKFPNPSLVGWLSERYEEGRPSKVWESSFFLLQLWWKMPSLTQPAAWLLIRLDLWINPSLGRTCKNYSATVRHSSLLAAVGRMDTRKSPADVKFYRRTRIDLCPVCSCCLFAPPSPLINSINKPPEVIKVYIYPSCPMNADWTDRGENGDRLIGNSQRLALCGGEIERAAASWMWPREANCW